MDNTLVDTAKAPFLIVAIGASSGGLEAVTELLTQLPANTGMAFIFIQHLSPNYKSILTQLLAKSTKMQVQEIADMELMEPNNVYVIPNNQNIKVTDGHIKLIPRTKTGPALSIDVLFTSLAETHGAEAIGIVLSGNASDGTMGLKAIKEAGGITFAQDSSAKYGSMPESAISEGVADFVLSPKEIALELSRISLHIRVTNSDKTLNSEPDIKGSDADLKSILTLLQKATSVDFGGYKMNTIKRRIMRRMLITRVKSLSQYATMLSDNKDELGLLYDDLLINVTEFFRDKDTFVYLKETLFPKLLQQKGPADSLRLWVTACSTGQEAYSMAIILIELFGDEPIGKQVKIFASDLSQQAIKKARAGIFTKDEVSRVSPQRLEQYFSLVKNKYRINKAVRDLCTFAPHNILSDPPFSKIDFISCCNMLIYFDHSNQKKVLTTFHYALNDGGVLMLGKSETTGNSELFTPASKKYQIYTRRKGIRTLPKLDSRSSFNNIFETAAVLPTSTAESVSTTIYQIIFSRYLPVYVVINQAMDIVQFKGDTSPYLQHPTGNATLNILSMARPELSFELREAINKSMESQKEVHREDIEVKYLRIEKKLALDVIPISGTDDNLLWLVVFTTANVQNMDDPKSSNALTKKKRTTIQRLKAELTAVQADLIALGTEKERSNNILQAANEEIQTSNEEFQSMNEELDTSKEEIECANEELITTNQELQTRNDQLAEAYDFSEAIVATMHEPMLILDKDMYVKQCNKSFCKTFMMLSRDVEGKMLYNLGNHQWDIPKLRTLLESVAQENDYVQNYELTHEFDDIGKKTFLLNARRIVQKVKDEQLILLAFTDITVSTQKRIHEKQELELIINDRTAALALSNTDLLEKNLSLEKANKELETFNFISSHDLQEPLRKINNFATYLLAEEALSLSASGQDYLKRMQVSVGRMQRLIDDLLSYSQIKKIGPNFELTDLAALAHEVVGELDDQLTEKNCIVKISSGLMVNIIPFQFRQLLQNLLTNAIKFKDGHRPMHIVIKAGLLPAKANGASGVVSGIRHCQLSVSDNGIGFDPHYSKRIFEVFQRLNSYEAYKGTGIGLAICKRIVDNHKGTITATGKLGKGARFDVRIPVV